MRSFVFLVNSHSYKQPAELSVMLDGFAGCESAYDT